MQRKETGACSITPRLRWIPRLAYAASALGGAGVLAWDAMQLVGPHGSERRQAVATALPHPVHGLQERQRASAVRAAERDLWVRHGHVQPRARELLAVLAASGDDGLDPQAYGLRQLQSLVSEAEAGDGPAVRRAPALLSEALVRYVTDLRRPAPGVQMVFADAALAPRKLEPRAIIEAATAAPSLHRFLAEARPANPLYGGLREALRACRSGETVCGARQRLLINLERARALPSDLGSRYILVNIPEQRLWLYEAGRPVDTMRVVVGRQTAPTPEMAGVLRYALFNPYWNIPEDLTRDTVGPAVLRDGVSYLRRQRLEILSDWTEAAQVVDPARVDWREVAAGRVGLRVRQKPGPKNMMGAVKFMLPNQLGIYLHDTPRREAFSRGLRAESAGCVRLQDARRLAIWLLGSNAIPPSSGQPEFRVPVSRPPPVYITYLTARPEEAGLVLSPDLYHRDADLVASLARKTVLPRG